MHIRIATMDDFARMLEIRHDTILKHAPQAYSEIEIKCWLQCAGYQEMMDIIDQQKFFVAVSDNRLIGTAGWNNDMLRHIYIDPAHTQQRVGSQLLTHIEQDYAKRTNHPVLKAQAVLYAVDFFKKHGFSVIEKVADWDGSGYYNLEKHLNSDN